ncbi:hypothetical protein DAEQUDRAFT_683813, partial [Daedalea quercina L-15889]
KNKPRKHFLNLPREVLGRVLQCRTGHGFIGEYYRSFVPTEQVDCPCGAPCQTRQHVLQDCPRHEPYRDILREVSKTIDLPTVLGTEDGIAALAQFLEKSGAFTKTGEPRETNQEAEVEEDGDTADEEPGEGNDEAEEHSDETQDDE